MFFDCFHMQLRSSWWLFILAEKLPLRKDAADFAILCRDLLPAPGEQLVTTTKTMSYRVCSSNATFILVRSLASRARSGYSNAAVFVTFSERVAVMITLSFVLRT